MWLSHIGSAGSGMARKAGEERRAREQLRFSGTGLLLEQQVIIRPGSR